MTDEIFRRFPDLAEGALTQIRAGAVSREACAVVARELGLDERFAAFARDRGAGAAEAAALSANANVLAALTESVIGAVFLDVGRDECERAVREAFQDRIEDAARAGGDAKSALQERLAQQGQVVEYRVVAIDGPAHERRYAIDAVVGGRALGHGSGPSKKVAEQAAAAEALLALEVPA